MRPSSLSPEEIEEHLWRLVLLVRCQERHRGLRLGRAEPQRRLLDFRVYELLIVFIMKALLSDGAVAATLPEPSKPRLVFDDGPLAERIARAQRMQYR